MKTGRYICDHDWHGNHTISVTVDARETEKSYILKLVQDDSRFQDGHMSVLFGKHENGAYFPPKEGAKAVIAKQGGAHAVVNHDDWFVVYPNQNGVPFLFEMVKEG